MQTKILPGVTHWQSPDYFAYFPSNSSVAGFLGEMLSAGINMVGFSWITSPAATELEMIVLDWLANLLKLPNDFLSKGKIPPNLIPLCLIELDIYAIGGLLIGT